MKTKIKLMALVAGLLATLPMTSAWANSYKYSATLTGTANPTGAGSVYVADTKDNALAKKNLGTYTKSGSSDQSGNNVPVTLYAYAVPNAGYEFTGWSGATATDGDTCSVSMTCTSKAATQTASVTANFAKIQLAAFGITFETSDAGTYTVDGAAPANKTGLTETTSVKLASSDPNFLNWKINGALVSDNPYTATCLADTTISAEFLTADQVAEATTFDELTAALANDGKKKIMISSGVQIAIAQGGLVTVPEGKILVNDGTLFVEGTLNNIGKIAGSGKISKCARLFTQANKNGEWGPEAEPVFAWPASPKIVYWVTTMKSNVGTVSGVSGVASHIAFRNGKGVYIRNILEGSSVPNVVAYSVDTAIAMNHVTAFSATSSNGLNSKGTEALSGLKVLTGNVSYSTAENSASKYTHSWGSTDCAGNTLTISKELGGGSNFTMLNGIAKVSGKVTGTDLTFVNCSSVTASSWTDSSSNYSQNFRFFDTTVVFGTSGINKSGNMKTGGDGMAFYSGKYDVSFSTPSKCKVYAVTNSVGTVFSGAFKNDPNNYLADSVTYEAKQRSSDKYWVVQIKKPPECVAVADGVEYEDLAEAISKSTSGVITLKKHVELDAPVTIPTGKSVTIELAGYNIAGATGVFVNNGTLTINDGSHNDQPSTVSAASGNLFVNNGTMEITCGTYSGAVLLNGGNFITHGGTFNVTLTAGTGVTDKSAVADLRGGKFKTDSQIAETTETVEAATWYIGGFLDEGYVAVPNEGMLWVGYGTYATAQEITMSGMDKAWELTAFSAADQTLYAKNPATREACANDAEWRRFQELQSMITPYKGKTIDCVLEFDRAIASGSVSAKASAFTMSLDEDIPANTQYSALIPRITQSQISYSRFVYDAEGIYDDLKCGIKNNSLDNIGATCTIYLYLKTETRDQNIGGVWTYTYPNFRPIVTETVKFTGNGAIYGTTDYISLAAALTTANYSGTIRLSKDCAEQIAVGKVTSFTLDLNNFDFTGAITAGDGYALTATDLGDGKTQYEVAREAVAKIGETAFASLAEAIEAAAESGETVDVVKESVLTVAEGIELTVTSGQLVAAVPAGNVLEFKDGTDVALTWPTVAGAADHIIVTGGRYSADPTDFLAEGLEAKEVGEKWVVGVKIVSGETETEIIVTTEKQESKVEKLEETEKAEVFKDVDADKVAEVVEKIEQTTKVEGVKLSVTETDEKPAGIVAVVEEAKKQDATFAAAVKSAAEVSVKVEVEVKPTEYVAPGEQAQGNTGKVAFKLTPKATVTVVQNETKLEKTVPVSNDMIDQNQKIAVSIYTGFRPVVITHDDDKGARIETFEGGQIVYNEATGVATVLISHFSTLTGFGNAEDVPPAKVFVAKIGEVTYMSLQAAVNAADNGAVITLLGGFSVDEAITVSGKAVEIRTEDYNTAATPTVGLRVNYFDKGKITANTIIYFRKSVNGNTVEIDRMLIGDFEMAIAALTAINSNEQVRYVIGLHGDVTLTKDIELPTNIGWSSTACINVKANCTFDLNGHSLTQKAGTGWSNYALFDVDCSYAVPEALNKMTFTLKNSSEGGSVQVPLHVLRTGIGTIVNIDGVDMVYGVGCTASDVAQDESSGGQAVVVIGSEGVVNLSDSRIVADKETILEGEYPWSLLPYAGEIKVASGYYEGLMYGNDTGFGGINITGGTFASDYILWFTAEGYHPANDGSDLRTVVPADEVVASITYNKGTADEYTEYFLDFSIATGYADETEAEEIKVENGASTGNVPEGWEVKTDPTTGETTLVKSVVAELLGSGTAEDPFVIMTREQLRYFGDKVTAAEKYNQVTDYVVLGADIDLGGEEWTPIGTSAFDHCFNGVFDGQGHEILNLKVSSTASNVGLFAFLSHESHEWSGERTTIRNLTIRNADVKGVSNVGVISGSAQQTVRFENVNVIGVVKVEGTGADVGGILGHTASRVKMTGCSVIATEGSGSYVKAKTSGSAACGGLLGFHAGEANVKTTISNCHVENITMSSYNRIGGIVGMVQMKSSYPAETEIFGNTVTNVSITVYGPGASTEKLNGRHSAQAGLIVGASTENGTRRYHFYHDNSYGGICSVTPTIATATDVIPTQLYGLWTLGTTRSKDAAARGLAYHADWANGNGDVVTEPEVTFGGDDYKTFLRAYFSQSETAVDAGATISSEDDPFVLHTDVGYTLIAQDRIYVKADGNIFYPRTDLGREIRSVDCGDGVTLYYVAPEGGVCKIGDRIFETLADAFREAKPTDTVVLTADAAMAVDAGVSPVCKIDMKGFTLSVPDDPAYDGKVVDSANAAKLLGYVVEDGVRAYSHEANDDFKNSGDEKGWDGSWGVYNIYLNGYAAVIEAQSSDVPAENIKITYQKDGVTHVALYNKVNYPARVFSGWKYPKANFGVDSSEKSLTVTVKSGKIEGIRASSKVTSKPTAETLDPVLASSTVNIEGGEVGSIVSSWNFNQSIDVYNVNVSGGKVGVIYGNGQTDRQSAFNHQNVDKSVYVPVVKEANITVTGGEIGTIYGGGYGNMNPMTTDPQGPWTMETKAANITVKSGVVGAIYGGGQCGAYGDFDKIVVDQANIAISGGCVGSVVKDSGVGRLAEVKEAVATLSGGIYTAKPDATYIAEGYAAENNPDEATKDAYPWKVQEPTIDEPIVIDIDPKQEGGTPVSVTVTQELVKEILGKDVDVTQPLTEAQVQTIVTQFETKGEDGMTGWQKYTAGFSQTDKHPLAPKGQGGENGQLVLVTSLIAPKPLSVDTGVKVKYILLKGSSVDEKTGLPTKWTKVQELPTPEFPVEVNLLDPETYWKIDAEYNATKQVQQ